MPVIAQTPILGTALRKSREVMQGGDAPRRLSEAMAKVSRLRERLAEIERERAEHSKRFSRHTAEKKAQFDASETIEHECEYVLAQVIENWVGEHASSAAQRAQALYGYGIPQTAEGDAFAKLAEEHPNWRKEVEAVLSLKAEIDEQAHRETEATVREQLSGFSDEDVQNDPRVKRSKTQAVRSQQLAQRFAEAKDLAAWKLAVDVLFPE